MSQLNPPPSGIIAERAFRAMNTGVHLVAADWQAGPRLAQAERLFHAIEARFSRFRTDSELSQMNAAAGSWFNASSEMLGLLSTARRYHEISGGIFEPAILTTLEQAGYDRSFEQVAREAEAASMSHRHQGHSIAAVEIDGARQRVRLPRGVRIDLGGIGKGYAVDSAARMLADLGPFLIDAGGDIFAAGSGLDGNGWYIGIADPAGAEQDLALVRLRDQAIATSATTSRRWRRGDRWLHHLIDPRDDAPAATGITSVSVIKTSATAADVFAKTALILGSNKGREFLIRQACAAIIVLDTGVTISTPGWSEATLQN